MESEGPYDLGDEMCVGADDSYKTLTTTLQVAIANRGFSEGRKSMEKETQISAPAGFGEKGLSPLREEQKKEAFSFLWNHANRASIKMDKKEEDFK